MAFRSTPVRALLLALTLALVALPGTALADETYAPSVMTSTTVTAKSPIKVGQSSPAKAKVTSDAVVGRIGNAALAAEGVPTGSIRFSLDGTHFATVPLAADATAPTTVPKRLLPEGTHVLRADYVPSAGSPYGPSSGTTRIVVTDCPASGCPNGGNDSGGGLLPNAGGVMLWLLLLALGLLAAGAAFVVAGRRRNA